MERSYETLDSFVIYICMEGSCLLQDNKGNRVTLRQGETLLLPADTASVTIQPGEVTRLLETFIE